MATVGAKNAGRPTSRPDQANEAIPDQARLYSMPNVNEGFL